MSLQKRLQAARIRGQLESAEFAAFGFASGALLAQAIEVLEQAMATDPDETRVLRWFTYKRLSAFSMQTPAEVVASGQAAALMEYIKVVDVRFTD